MQLCCVENARKMLERRSWVARAVRGVICQLNLFLCSFFAVERLVSISIATIVVTRGGRATW